MSIVIKSNEGDYKTVASDFVIRDDLYLFFKFSSPKSDCEIATAYDVYIDSCDWYVNDGDLDSNDYAIVDDVLFDKLPDTPEFSDFLTAVDNAKRKFNLG